MHCRAISAQAKYLKRTVTLAGFNQEYFSQCIQSITAVESTFSKSFHLGEIEPWKKKTYLSYDAVTLANRYFTDTSQLSFLEGVLFTKEEDPDGNLSALSQGRELRHCEENVVRYFLLQKGRYVPISYT
jgi:hypothetical protein